MTRYCIKQFAHVSENTFLILLADASFTWGGLSVGLSDRQSVDVTIVRHRARRCLSHCIRRTARRNISWTYQWTVRPSGDSGQVDGHCLRWKEASLSGQSSDWPSDILSVNATFSGLGMTFSQLVCVIFHSGFLIRVEVKVANWSQANDD